MWLVPGKVQFWLQRGSTCHLFDSECMNSSCAPSVKGLFASPQDYTKRLSGRARNHPTANGSNHVSSQNEVSLSMYLFFICFQLIVGFFLCVYVCV